MGDDADRLKQQAEAFAKLWTDFASRMGTPGAAPGAGAPSADTARQVRDAMFEGMAAYCDQFMRSPEFLGQLKQSLDGAMEMREQLNAFLTQVRHETQGVSLQDVDGVRHAVEALHQLVVGQIERLDERLDAIEASLATPAPRTAPARSRSPGTAKRTRKSSAGKVPKAASKKAVKKAVKKAATARRARKGR